MRIEELLTENLDEAMPKWVKGAAAAGGIAAAALGGSMLSKQNTANVATATAQKPAVKTFKQATEPAKSRYALQDLDYLHATLFGEARADLKSLASVGWVILNRASDKDKSIKDVVTHPKQFSCWNPGDPNFKRIKEMRMFDKIFATKQSPVPGKTFEEWVKRFKNTGDYLDYRAWIASREYAKKLLSGEVRDPTGGATFYHTTTVKPKWRHALQRLAVIGNHIFYKEKPKNNVDRRA